MEWRLLLFPDDFFRHISSLVDRFGVMCMWPRIPILYINRLVNLLHRFAFANHFHHNPCDVKTDCSVGGVVAILRHAAIRVKGSDVTGQIMLMA